MCLSHERKDKKDTERQKEEFTLDICRDSVPMAGTAFSQGTQHVQLFARTLRNCFISLREPSAQRSLTISLLSGTSFDIFLGLREKWTGGEK